MVVVVVVVVGVGSVVDWFPVRPCTLLYAFQQQASQPKPEQQQHRSAVKVTAKTKVVKGAMLVNIPLKEQIVKHTMPVIIPTKP